MKNKKITLIILVFSVAVFYAFGLYHLAKFETVDEHFWRFKRIHQYWDSIAERDAKGTYINDKPGITVALISGVGLSFERHPEELRIRDAISTQNDNFTVYDWKNIENVNLALRGPIIIFNGLFLLLFFWLIRKITENNNIALFSVFLIALSPILIGISQIMNPDALLWSFSLAAILSYFALLKTRDWRFIIMTGVFTGLSLLSKYSANILFPLYIFSFCSFFIFHLEITKKAGGTKKYFLRCIIDFLAIAAISVAVFSFFLPAVFVSAKYLYRGTIGMPGMKIMLAPMVIFLLLLLADTLILKSWAVKSVGSFFEKNQNVILKAICSISVVVFLTVIINCWLGQKLIPFDDIRDSIYLHPKAGLEAPLKKSGIIAQFLKTYLTEFYPFVFSLSIPVLILVMGLWLKVIFGKKDISHRFFVFFISSLPLIYFLALMITEVSANTRYSIMLYPLFYLLAAISFFELIRLVNFSFIKKQHLTMLLLAIIFISSFFSLWQIKPFYFNYTNSLLPKDFLIHDSWGYGEYEAAQYLNSLPNAQNLIIWSDRSAICQFIKGKCIRDYKIDLEKTRPDYFILSRRGVMRHQFLWKNPALAQKPSVDYYEKAKNNPEWSIIIDDRPENYVKVIKSEE